MFTVVPLLGREAIGLTASQIGALTSTTLSALDETQVGALTATQIGMIDGYGIAFDASVGKIRLSNLNDFTTWDPTQFAIRSAAPDNWRAMCVNALAKSSKPWRWMVQPAAMACPPKRSSKPGCCLESQSKASRK